MGEGGHLTHFVYTQVKKSWHRLPWLVAALVVLVGLVFISMCINIYIYTHAHAEVATRSCVCDPFHGLSGGGSCDAGEGRHLLYCIVSRSKKPWQRLPWLVAALDLYPYPTTNNHSHRSGR